MLHGYNFVLKFTLINCYVCEICHCDMFVLKCRLSLLQMFYRFLPFIIHAASGAVCYYFSRVACKLCMQGFSFSLPLTVITPATVAVFCYVCDLQQVSLHN